MKILFFYPENPLSKTQGNNVRAHNLLKYFKEKKYSVDFVSKEENISLISESDLKDLKDQNLVNKTYFLKPLNKKKSILKKTFFNRKTKSNDVFSRVLHSEEVEFEKIVNSTKYDYIIISYAYYVKLIDKINLNGAKTIIDTHDFLTSQHKETKDFNLGQFFEDEIKVLRKFDFIWAISIEEQYLFTQFINKPIILVPHCVSNKNYKPLEKQIDLLYVASGNTHNIKSIDWFFKEIYPELDKKIKITIVGKICNYIDNYDNVKKIDYVENLDPYYLKAKVVICPMLSGTGLKIKVVEALSFGLPVVCTPRGVDGLINKTENGCLVANDAEEMIRHINNLLNDYSYYEKFQKEALNFFKNHLEFTNVKNKLDVFFK